MPSSVPPKKRKYNADKEESRLSMDVIDMLSLPSSPAASTQSSSSSSSSSGQEESTLGSSFSPNMASVVDTQALSSSSPDFQTQNSFVVDLQTTTVVSKKKQNNASVEKASSFTLTRMTTNSNNQKNQKKQTPRRKSPRHKNPLPVNEDEVGDDVLWENRIAMNEPLASSSSSSRKRKSVETKMAASDTPQAKQKQTKKEETTSQGSEKTSKVTNASEAKAPSVKEVMVERQVPTSAAGNTVNPAQDNKAVVSNKKKRPLQENAPLQPTTTTTPPKSKAKKEQIQKDTSVPANPIKEVENTRTARGKENTPASKPQKTKATAASTEDMKTQTTTTIKKKKKLTFQDQVFQHMMFSYKPFTLKSLAQELKTTEAALNFLMLSLVDKNLVVKKEFSTNNTGRSKELYWVNYDTKGKELQMHLATASEIQLTQQEHDKLFQEHTRAQNMWAAFMGDGPSNEDLSRQLEEAETQFQNLQSELNELKGRIQAVQGGGGKEQNPKRLKQSINCMRDIWKKRREQCNDFVEQLADGMEKKPKDVIKLLELELDGDIQMPAKYKVE